MDVKTTVILQRHAVTLAMKGAKPIAAARVVQECLEAKATLNY